MVVLEEIPRFASPGWGGGARGRSVKWLDKTQRSERGLISYHLRKILTRNPSDLITEFKVRTLVSRPRYLQPPRTAPRLTNPTPTTPASPAPKCAVYQSQKIPRVYSALWEYLFYVGFYMFLTCASGVKECGF